MNSFCILTVSTFFSIISVVIVLHFFDILNTMFLLLQFWPEYACCISSSSEGRKILSPCIYMLMLCTNEIASMDDVTIGAAHTQWYFQHTSCCLLIRLTELIKDNNLFIVTHVVQLWSYPLPNHFYVNMSDQHLTLSNLPHCDILSCYTPHRV